MSSEYVKQVIDPSLVSDGKVIEDNSIQESTYVSYPPTSQTSLAGNSGTIRFHINQSDQFVGLFNSWLRVHLHIKRTGALFTNVEELAPIHNFFFHLFSTMRLEMNGQEVQRIEDPAVVNTMVRNILATVDDDKYGLESGFKLDTSYRTTGGIVDGTNTTDADVPVQSGPEYALDFDVANLNSGDTTATSEGWYERRQFISRYSTATNVGKVALKIPLKEIFTFARDYTKYLYGFSYTLSLTRADVETASRRAIQGNTSFSRTDPLISIDSMEWVVNQVRPSLEIQDKLYRKILDKVEYPVAFRDQRSAKFQTPSGGAFTWNASSVNISSEKPLYALISFTRDRDGANAGETIANNHALFEDPDVSDIAVYANGYRVPIETQSYKNKELQFTDVYSAFQEFKHKFLGLPAGVRSPISLFDFRLMYMTYVFDLTRLPEQLRSGTVNLTVKCKSNNGSAFSNDITAHMVLFTKQILMAKSDGARMTFIRQ